MQRATVAHLQLVTPGVRGIQQAQAHPAAGYLDIRTLHPVDQQRITDKTTAAGFAVLRHAKVIQSLVLNNDREVVDAVMIRDRQRFTHLIFDQPHPGQAVVNLLSGTVRRIGVIPQRGGVLTDGQHGCPVCVWRHHASRTAHQRTRNLQTGDSHRDIFRQTVTVDKLNVIPFPDADRRSEVTPVNAPDRRTRALGY